MEALSNLVSKVQGGDLKSYNSIVHRFQDMAVGYAFSLVGDFHLAEDAAQEAFIHAYLDLSKLREPAAFPGWFRQIVFSQCNRYTRRKRIQTLDIDDNPDIASHEKGPAEQMEDREQKDQIETAIQTLSEEERSVITLYYINEFSQSEIAQFLEIPVSKVNNRLHASRQHLKEEFMRMARNNLQSKRPSRDGKFVKQISELIPAIEAVTSGDVVGLKSMLEVNPGLVKARANEEIDPDHSDGYFSSAMLLHYVAGNPIRGDLPENVVEVTQALIDAGAEVDAATQFGDWSWTTLGLVASGKQAYSQGFAEALIDTLADAGAQVNYNNGMNLYGALVHTQECKGQKEVGRMLFKRGAEVDLCFASALGERDLAEGFFKDDGSLNENAYSLYRPERDRMSDPSELEILSEAFIWSCFNNCPEMVDFYLSKGVDINTKTSIGGNRATGLHRAAVAGWDQMVATLLEKGADPSVTDDEHGVTPLDWANHAKRPEVAAVFRNQNA
jgi:RNA polymerase sigma factor (sigma-70 family)